MRNTIPAFIASVALLVGIAGAATPNHARAWRRHQNHPARANVESSLVDQNVTSRALERRFDDARFTYYAAGQGACGQTNSASDFIVAMNSAQYAGGAHCFQTITITVGGQSTSAEVVDECPGCPFAGLDFSSGLFEFFAPESVGVLTGSWVFGSGAPPPSPSPPPPPKPTTHTTPPPPPSTTASSTTAASTSSQSSSRVVASSSPVSSTGTTSSASTSASAAASVANTPLSGNLEQMYLAYLQIMSLPLTLVGLNGTTATGSGSS